MILVTTGTSGPAFDRLLRAADRLAGDEELVVQHGPSSLRPRNAACVEYVPFSELVDLVRRARVVVTHAGVGSILVALMNGKRPLVVPRLARFGEVVDDHQLELARRLDEAGLVTLVEDVARLPELVPLASAGVAVPNGRPSDALLDGLRSYLSAVTAGDPPAR